MITIFVVSALVCIMSRRPSGKEVSGGGFRQYGAKILITYTEKAGKGSVCKL